MRASSGGSCSKREELGIVVLRGPLEGLGDVAGFRYVPERSVGIRRADVAGGTEDFADIFGDVVAVGEPGAVFLNRERTRRRRLRFFLMFSILRT